MAQKYSYSRIEDLVNPDDLYKYVNLIGIVVEMGIPKKNPTSDPCVRLFIVDKESCPNRFGVQIFASSMEELPQVKFSGDIIKLFRVQIREYEGELYALFHRRCSSFSLYDGNHGWHYTPYQSSSRCHLTTEKDKTFIMKLRGVDYNFEIGSYESSSFSLDKLTVGSQFHLYCKVLLKRMSPEYGTVLYVWDGKDVPPLPVVSNQDDENAIALTLENNSVPRDRLINFPRVGTVLRVTVDQSIHEEALRVLQSDKWVKLINIKIDTHNGFWRGKILAYSKLRYLRDDDPIALQIQTIYDDRVTSKFKKMPQQFQKSFSRILEIWSCIDSLVHFDTLMDAITHPEEEGRLYNCIVRIVSARLLHDDSFLDHDGSSRLKVRFTLEDPTARIHADLYEQDVEAVFGVDRSAEEMSVMKKWLLGIRGGDAQRDPPWVYCGIESCQFRDTETGIFNMKISDCTRFR